ncbi:hypothetical protein J2129_000148 [Methanofollis sp. W23]|nr:hypothetical protein [Methanofollis sp. W23]
MVPARGGDAAARDVTTMVPDEIARDTRLRRAPFMGNQL